MNDIVIQTDKIVKTYASGSNEVHALRGIDLTAHRGEFIAIMGASGSGKSTLMNLLGCLDMPTSGSYSLDGVRVELLARTKKDQDFLTVISAHLRARKELSAESAGALEEIIRAAYNRLKSRPAGT